MPHLLAQSSSCKLELPPAEKVPTEQDQYEVCIDLVTMAGTEYTMQTNITHYEDMLQLEDDISVSHQPCQTLMFLAARST